MIIYQSIDAVDRNHILKALVVQAEGINDGFCKYDGLRSLNRTVSGFDKSCSGAWEVEVRDLVVTVDVAAIEIHNSAPVIMKGKDHIVEKDLMTLAVQDPDPL